MQVQNHHPIATCELFPFDWTLIFNVSVLKIVIKSILFSKYLHCIQVIGATTTYLTIILNLESAHP